MGNHRADAGSDSRPSVTTTPYVGKRRALPVDGAPAETASPTPYVGRRRAAVADPEKAQPLSRDTHEATDDHIDTGELRALVELELTDTAPRPRVAGDDVLAVPTPRRPRLEPAPAPKPLFVDDTADTAADTATDAVAEPSAEIPVETAGRASGSDGGRRRATRRDRRSRFRAVPSMPVVVGAAALAVSAIGVITTTHSPTVPTSTTRLTGASALTGTSSTASVASTTGVSAGRAAPLSRGGGRDAVPNPRAAANATAQQRAQALGKLDAQAAGQDKYLHSNAWGLPIEPGVYHLTARFGQVSGLWASVHTGLDFACPTGTPIHAVARGTITFTGWDGSYGNKTVETLPDGTEIWYAHQSAINVSVGDSISEGQVIGLVGATGNVTGPHVHIEVRPGGGDPVDPDPAFNEHGVNPDANQ